MFPLAAISTGISLLGGIEGLISGNRQQAEAEAAEQQALEQLQASGQQQYNQALAGGTQGLYGLTGSLNDALQRTGKGLGAAMAGAGVYNSTATAGALANQAQGNASQIAGYQSNLANLLANINNQTNQEVAGYRWNMASNNLNYARQQLAGSQQGFGSALGALGQFNFSNNGGVNPAGTPISNNYFSQNPTGPTQPLGFGAFNPSRGWAPTGSVIQ